MTGKKNDDSHEMATKADVREILEVLDRAFRHVLTKKDARGFATKKDLAGFATKKDLAGFATKKDLAGLKQELIYHINARMEIRDDELDGVHQDELDVVAGKKEAPKSWRSIPRRVRNLEQEVTNIQDKLWVRK